MMSRASSDIVALDRASKAPVYRQIYDSTKQAIAAGTLRPGERLPSARSLAARHGPARGTVDAAYAQLAGEGWIVARGAAGTVVAPQLGSGVSAPVSRSEVSGRATAASLQGLAPVALSAHTIAHDTGPGLLLSFTNIPEAQAEAAAAALFRAIDDRLGMR